MLFWLWLLWDLATPAQFQGSEMSPGLFQDFMVFIPGVTQANENAGSVQDFVFLFWCKSRELGDRESPRFSCVTLVAGSFSLDFFRVVISYYAEPHWKFCQTSMMELFRQNS